MQSRFVYWVCPHSGLIINYMLIYTYLQETMKSVGSHGRYLTAVHDEGNDGITL